MKNITKLFILFSFIGLICISCNDDEENEIKVYEYKEQIGKKIKEVTDLQANSEFGVRKDMYPETSRQILEEASDSLKELLDKINSRTIETNQIPAETQKQISETDEAIERFKATIRTGDYIVAGELQIKGSNGGHINFGVHPEYSVFGGYGEQTFTVECWIRLESNDETNFILSTFIEDNDAGNRRGWAINRFKHSGDMRMTYTIENWDLMEPGFSFDPYLNEWVHIAVVTDEKPGAFNGETDPGNDNRAVMTKIYINGQQVVAVATNHPGKAYRSNDYNVPLVGFIQTDPAGNPKSEFGSDGSMKHFRLWKSAKTADEVNRLMKGDITVTGDEEDLVCGWPFDMIPLDNNDIIDVTGRFSAKLIGDFTWIEK